MRSFIKIAALIIVFVVSGCASPQSPIEVPLASDPSQTATNPPTAAATFTPTITPTPRLPVSEATPVPTSPQALSAENIEGVTELARWGRGIVEDAAYSPDGKLIALGSSVGITIHNSATYDDILFIDLGVRVNSLAFSPDGKFVGGGLRDNTVKIWQISDGVLVKTFEHPEEDDDKKDDFPEQVNSIAFSADGKLLASGSSEGKVDLWNVSDGSLVHTYTGHAYSISSLFFSPDDQNLFSGSFGGNVHVTSVSDGTFIKAFGGERVVDADLSPDGKTLATFDYGLSKENASLIIWDVNTGKKTHTIKAGSRGSDAISISFSPDGQFIAGGCRDYTVKVWRVSNGTIQNTYEDLKPKTDIYYYVFPAVDYSPDGKSLLFAGKNLIATWDIQTNILTHQSKLYG